MKININSVIKTISRKIIENFEFIWCEEEYILDMLLLVREDMIVESGDECIDKLRIYNQYNNKSCQQLFQYNRDVRLYDLNDYLHRHSDVYFTVECCRCARRVEKVEVLEAIKTDINDIIRYILKNNSKNEITKRLYKELIADNL